MWMYLLSSVAAAAAVAAQLPQTARLYVPACLLYVCVSNSIHQCPTPMMYQPPSYLPFTIPLPIPHSCDSPPPFFRSCTFTQPACPLSQLPPPTSRAPPANAVGGLTQGCRLVSRRGIISGKRSLLLQIWRLGRRCLTRRFARKRQHHVTSAARHA